MPQPQRKSLIILPMAILLLLYYLANKRYGFTNTIFQGVNVYTAKFNLNQLQGTASGSGNDNEQYQQKPVSRSSNCSIILPFTYMTLPADVVLQSQWVTDMKLQLSKLNNSNQVTLLMVNFDYFGVLVNWLANIGQHSIDMIDSIIILSLDSESHEVLTRKGMKSVAFDFDNFFAANRSKIGFGTNVIARNTVLRLLNYWGYDVFQCDIDAIITKNIWNVFDLFKESDIISSTAGTGCIPRSFYKKWHFCLCNGVILVKSTQKTEQMWQELNYTAISHTGSDQTRLNDVLMRMKLVWFLNQTTPGNYLHGQTSNGLLITALPQTIVCRTECDITEQSSFYGWHQRSGHAGHKKFSNIWHNKLWRIGIGKWKTTLENRESPTSWISKLT